MTTDRSPRTLEEYEARARDLLPKEIYDYYAGGAGDEWTLAENRRAFERWVVRPRVLVGVGEIDPSTEVLGCRISFPVMVAPMAAQWAAHAEGEVATARAAERAGTLMALSSTAQSSIEEMGKACEAQHWYQLYVYKDRGFTQEMVRRAHAAGFGAVMLTVDTPYLGMRDRDVMNDFEMPPGIPQVAWDFAPDLTWADIEWVRGLSPLPIAVKGVLTGEDAKLAVEHGVDAVVVSNHGGRQLDGVPAALSALPEVAEAVDGGAEVLMDGGVRRGVDVLKALALGARAVFVGRPILYGLAVGGEEGVGNVLRVLKEEFENAMALAGCRSVKEIVKDFVAPADG